MSMQQVASSDNPSLLLRGADVPAEYKRSPLVQYKGNPLIEALPPIMPMVQVIKRLANVIKFRENDRKKNATIRAHNIFQLSRFVEPMEQHLQIEQNISIILRDGYVARNPLTTNSVRILREGAENVRAAMTSQTVKLPYNYKTSGSGLTIIGVSGMGKTTAINSILLKIYPAQIIRHGQYKGRNLNFAQLVWLKLETPPSGSVKGLCLNFFQAIDQLLGTNYYETFKKRRSSAVELIPEMAQLCATYRIGMLIMDEIQHLHGTGGADEMLNFFVTLKNAIGIPIVMIGTFKAWNLLTREFRETRRAVEYFGMIEWNRMMNEEDEYGSWRVFLSALWNYQWTRNVAPLDDEMIDVLYAYSQGITDVAVKLFMVAQWRAIATGEELITPSLIENVAKNELRALFPVIQAFRLSDTQKLEQALDVFQKDFEIESHFNSVMEELVKKLKQGRTDGQNQNEKVETDLTQEVVKWLNEAGIMLETAESLVKKVQEVHGSVSLPELKSLSYQLFLESKRKIEKGVRSQPRVGARNRGKKSEPKEIDAELSEDIKRTGEI